MGSFVPRTTLSQFKKRRKISIDGHIPGVLYSRQHRSQQPATVPIDRPASAGAPQTYMAFHPDAYEPHPGEAVFATSHYTPYQTQMPRSAPDELRGQEFSIAHTEPVNPRIDSDLAAYLLQRFVNDLTSQPAPDVIPTEHDVAVEGPSGPTLNASDADRGAIGAIWDRVLDQPRYDALSMTNELFAEAMLEATRVIDVPESATVDEDVGSPDWSPAFEDLITERDDGALRDQDIEAFNDPNVPSAAADAIYEPGIHERVGIDELPAPESPGSTPFDGEFDMPGMNPLEQIVADASPSVLEPGPMMVERPYPDEILMDPWMMPGMGLMPPGLGPMGPMGPLGPIM